MTVLTTNITTEIQRLLSEKLGELVKISSSYPVSGGDINNAYRIDTNHGSFFIKTNVASRFPNMFEEEANGLQLLRESRTITIPKVIAVGRADDASFLLLEWIESSNPAPSFWENFGTRLAELHQTSNDCFGLNESNYIGSLKQSNRACETWLEFFMEERLQKQIEFAANTGKMTNEVVHGFEALFAELKNIFPTEPPALIHGDLWNGNFMVGSRDEPVIVDPAVYYGHREMDIAMTKLFGGFNQKFYDAYHNQYPLEKGWESRVDICNLYPLMVHVNLFGGGYLSQVKAILNQFS